MWESNTFGDDILGECTLDLSPDMLRCKKSRIREDLPTGSRRARKALTGTF